MRQRGEWPTESPDLIEEITKWLKEEGREFSMDEFQEDKITEKQLDYLEILIEKRNWNVQVALGEAMRAGVIEPPMNHLYELTKKEASKMITWLKEEEDDQ